MGDLVASEMAEIFPLRDGRHLISLESWLLKCSGEPGKQVGRIWASLLVWEQLVLLGGQI